MTQWTVTLPAEEDTVAFGRRLGRTVVAEYAGTGLIYLIVALGIGTWSVSVSGEPVLVNTGL